MISLLKNCSFSERLTILEQDAGLHFLLKIDTDLPDRELENRLEAAGIRVKALSSYFHDEKEDLHCLVVNYSGLKEEAFALALEKIKDVM